MKKTWRCPACGRTYEEAIRLSLRIEDGTEDSPFPCPSESPLCPFDAGMAIYYKKRDEELEDRAIEQWARLASKEAERW